MAEPSDRSSLLGDQRNDGSPGTPSYVAGTQSQTRANQVTRLMQLAFVAIVVIMVAITMILSIVRAAKVEGLYIMMGLSLMGLCAIVVILGAFIKKGELPAQKSWFLYVVGGCILLEAIFTDVLLYQ